MYRMFFPLCLSLLFWGQVCHAATAEDLYGTTPGQHNQNSTIINGDVYIDNRNGMTPGFAGTWRDPDSGDIITSVIAPRQQMNPTGQNNVYAAPYMSGDSCYGNGQSDRHPQRHKSGYGPGRYPGSYPGQQPGYVPPHYPGQVRPPSTPPQMRPPGVMPGMPPASMRPIPPAPPGMPGALSGGGR